MDGRPGRNLKKWFSYAAAVVLLLSVGSFWFLYTDNKPEVGENMTVESGWRQQSYAILTLADGTKVDLKDQVSQIALAGGEKALKVDEGSLSYEGVPDTDRVEAYHTLSVPRGGEYVLMLADGSSVYLNAESSLTYPVSFRGRERKVYLDGEAYFKVAKNAEMPFIVDVRLLEVEVTGTAFGVRAYRQDEEIRTTLESGRVSVKAGERRVNLVPDHQALFDKKTAALDVFAVDTDLYLAWKDGRLVFDSCPLEKILEELSRWYAFEVFYSRNELRQAKFSVNMKKHESFTDVLSLIEDTGDVRFEIKGRTVIVK